MGRKKRSRWQLIILTAGLLAINMPLTVQAEDIGAETEVKEPERQELPEKLESASDEAIKKRMSAGESAETKDVEEVQDKELRTKAKSETKSVENPQADSSDKSGGLYFQWMNELPKEETTYSAGGGQISWIPKVQDDEVISGTVILQDAVIESTEIGLGFPVPVEIKAEGQNRITSDSIGICLSKKEGSNPPGLELKITGTGSLEINSKNNGIQTAGDIVIDTVRLTVIYGTSSDSFKGLLTTMGDIEIKNSEYIKVRSNPDGIGSNSSAIYAGQNRGQNVRIEKSHVIAITEDGAAIDANAGSIELISSDVRAVGNTNNNLARGALSFFDGCTMDGGTLFANNKGGDLAIPSVPTQPLKASNSAVLYDGKEKGIPLEGDLVLYLLCTYDEDADEITTVERSFVFGDVTWNDNMRFGIKKGFTIGYIDKPSSLTIPEGVTVELSDESWFNVGNSDPRPNCRLINNGIINVNDGTFINNYPNSVIENNGTINILKGGQIYNFYIPKTSSGGVFQNNGEMIISQGGLFQNQGRLENDGTIEASGTFSEIRLPNYDGSIAGEGEINGFLVEMHSDSTVYAASGRTVLKKGQMLTLKPIIGSQKAMKLKVLDGAELIIEEGAIVDAKTYMTKDTVADVIDLSDTMVVNGQLWLPSDIPEETLTQITDKITGNGEVNTGSTPKNIINIKIGEESRTQLVEQGGTVNLPENPSREGYNFGGWYVKDGDAFKEFDSRTPIKQSMEILSKWIAINEWTTPLTIDDWTYGSEAAVPTAIPEYGEDKVQYTYCDSKDGPFTKDAPREAGIWYVKAAVEAFEEGLEGYTSLESEPVSFKIEPKGYEDGGSITISEIKSEEDIDNLTIKDGGITLKKDTDYTVEKTENGKEVTVTITFKGNYSGTIEKTFKKPEEPDIPDKPDKPVTPDKPDTPDQPDTPDTPGKPDTPDQPDKPDTPDKPDQPDTPDKPDTPETPALSKSDIEKSTIKLNAKAQAIPSGSKLKVTWGKVSLADGYDIYAEKCGNRMALVKSIKGSGKTNFSITRIGRKKISQKAAYKIQIRAYRIVNGKKQIIAKSLTLHTAGKAQKNYTNVKSLKASKTKITLKTGVSKKVTAKLAKQNSKKKLFPKSHVAAYRYYSTDQSVASVSKNGIVRGKKKGNCTVYIVAANGMKKGIKVTVK